MSLEICHLLSFDKDTAHGYQTICSTSIKVDQGTVL